MFSESDASIRGHERDSILRTGANLLENSNVGVFECKVFGYWEKLGESL